MKQQKSIEKLKGILPNIQGIQLALLYGSFGRNEANPNSDIDIQILVNEEFETNNFVNILKQEFQSDFLYANEVALRNKIVLYLKTQPKIEFAICKNIEEITRNYLGSEISDIPNTVLYAEEYWKPKITSHLEQLVALYNESRSKEHRDAQISELIAKFLYEFENCSNMHRRSDGYQFYFFYNIALQVAIQLHHISKGETKFNFLPKNFIANTLKSDERKSFYELNGRFLLPEGNQQKRKLLDFFYASIDSLVSHEKIEEEKSFLEWVFERDFFWNFRDISTLNSKIKSGIVYRTGTLSLYQQENRFEDLLNKNQIKTVIDLRADREIEEYPYNDDSLSKFDYVKAQLDPWNQPDWFKEKYHYGTNEEIAYRFFGLGCNDKIKDAMETIINENSGAVAIHCHAGKDRTGILISMLHLLVDSPLDAIYADYMASESDTKQYRLDMVLDIINSKGGIVPYLIECGLNEYQIEQLINKLLNGN
jgi:protein tyrosine/serine phosphatase/predicted nucleotidyltransferase